MCHMRSSLTRQEMKPCIYNSLCRAASLSQVGTCPVSVWGRKSPSSRPCGHPSCCLACQQVGCSEPFSMYTLFSALLSNDQNTRVNGSGGWKHKTGSDQWLPLHSQSHWEKSTIPQNPLFCFFLLPQKTYEKEIRLKFMRQEPWSAQCRQKGGKQDSPLGLVMMNPMNNRASSAHIHKYFLDQTPVRQTNPLEMSSSIGNGE